jgi:hypothetical protein
MNALVRVLLGVTIALGTATGSAHAQGKEQAASVQPGQAGQPAPPAQPSGATAEVKAGTGYQSFAVVGEATSFPAGTLVFAVSTVRGADGTTVKHVWKKDGAELWTASLRIGSSRWTTSSRRLLNQPGQYTVSVLAEDGSEIGKVDFTIQ